LEQEALNRRAAEEQMKMPLIAGRLRSRRRCLSRRAAEEPDEKKPQSPGG
jgi:hypothetical protein